MPHLAGGTLHPSRYLESGELGQSGVYRFVVNLACIPSVCVRCPSRTTATHATSDRHEARVLPHCSHSRTTPRTTHALCCAYPCLSNMLLTCTALLLFAFVFASQYYHPTPPAAPSMFSKRVVRCGDACRPGCATCYFGIENTYVLGLHGALFRPVLAPDAPADNDEVSLPLPAHT